MRQAEIDGWKVRPYTSADIPQMVELVNLEYPDEPTTVEQEEHWERTYPQDNPRLRLAVEDAAGRLIGVGSSLKPFWFKAPGVFHLFLLVHPNHRSRGIGRDLIARHEAHSRAQGAEKLWADCRESQEHSIRFLECAGFTRYGIRFESAIDVERFDPAQYAAAIARVEQAGYRLTTLADLRKERPGVEPDLYQVALQALRDVPFPGGAEFSMDYDQWLKGLENPAADPRFYFVALRGDEIAGMTTLELPQDGPAITDSTGVLREHRNRGVALALKATSLAALKKAGRTEARTHNDTENPAILHLNEKLGYRRLPGWLQYEKRLG